MHRAADAVQVRVSETIVEVLRCAHIVPMLFRENDTA
jgi:hypothetical protein